MMVCIPPIIAIFLKPWYTHSRSHYHMPIEPSA
jgi:hypothetical protein